MRTTHNMKPLIISNISFIMSNLPQDTATTEEAVPLQSRPFFPLIFLLLLMLKQPSITPSLREQRSGIRALKSEMAQHSQILTSLSTQLSKLVDLFGAATPPAGEPQTPPVHALLPLPRDEESLNKSFLHLMERLQIYLVNPSP